MRKKVNKELDFLVTVICPLKELTGVNEHYLKSLHGMLKSRFEQFEIILVLDGPTSDAGKVVHGFVNANEGFRLIRLIKGYGLDISITAGLDSAIGDVIVVCLPPFDPVEIMPEFIRLARAGRIGVGQRPSGQYEGAIRKFSKKCFYYIANRFLDFNLPSDTTYFVSFPRQAVTYIQSARDKFRFLKVVTAQTGLPIDLIKYTPIEQDGRIYRSFLNSLLLSVDVITSQSVTLLRFSSALSLLLSAASLMYLLYAINIFIFKDNVQQGWSSLSIFISGSFFLLGFVVAVITEYLSKIIGSTSNEPLYSAANEIYSVRTVNNFDTPNVLETSNLEEDI
jgi:glycosyltransferase involved in cell wall biosynthesis